MPPEWAQFPVWVQTGVVDACLCNGHISKAPVHASRMDPFPRVDSGSNRPMDVS